MKKTKTAKIKKSSVSSNIKKSDGKLVGIVSHYFSNISVGVIKLSAPLGEGDEIRIIGGEGTDFSQKIDSMQIDHKKVKKAKKGNSVGLKTDQKVREGYKVYKI
jgi:putative protease